ncbi:hypothetical protein F5888DRAFT_1758018 [Russula emetica]|nr:hypothetical protein F5888DRAFT_1758018 [Russula emetica]
MDPALQPSAPQNTLPTMPTSSAKRSRENESPSQRHKREKAAERQRRKRERDRNASLQNGIAGMAAAQQQQQQQQQQPSVIAVTHPQQPLNTAPPQSAIVPTTEPTFVPPPTELSPAELSRRERVRTAARERQRKHRALVKQKKLRELGLDMGNELGGVQELEDIQYRLAAAAAAADGAPFGALQHELEQQPPHIPGQPDPAFTPGHNGGQTFASTLLLSFSCAPLLKQHILRTLSMTNEELASLEPIIAQAWDQWDHQRRIHYAQQAQVAASAGKPPDGHPLGGAPPPPPPPATFAAAVELSDAQAAGHPYPTADPNHQQQPQQQRPPQPPPPQANDFRARFHRSLIAPSPFGTFAPPPPPPPAPADGIDPHLGTTEQSPKVAAAVAAAAAAAAIDPELGQARSEAEVVGRLERG